MREGSIIVNDVHHLQAEYREDLLATKLAYRQKYGTELIVATDQEGGKVSRLRRLFPNFRFYSQQQMSEMTDAEGKEEFASEQDSS